MDITNYLENTYRWMQKLLVPEKIEKLWADLMTWLESRTPLETADWLKTTLITVVVAGVVLDLVLYWTRRDQRSLLRRIGQSVARGIASLQAKTQKEE